MSRSIIFMDTEFTTWEGALQNNWGEDWQHREIVQIAAVKVDRESFEIIGKFDQLVKPARNPNLSEFFVELTGITQQDVDENGISYKDAHLKYADFVDGAPIWCYGWDGTVMAENCELIGTPALMEQFYISTLKAYFEEQGVDTSKINSGKLADYFGVDIKIREHNAMDDVYSIHAALQHLNNKGVAMPFN